MRPHIAKSYFETYKIYDHMQNPIEIDNGEGEGMTKKQRLN